MMTRLSPGTKNPWNSVLASQRTSQAGIIMYQNSIRIAKAVALGPSALAHGLKLLEIYRHGCGAILVKGMTLYKRTRTAVGLSGKAVIQNPYDDDGTTMGVHIAW